MKECEGQLKFERTQLEQKLEYKQKIEESKKDHATKSSEAKASHASKGARTKLRKLLQNSMIPIWIGFIFGIFVKLKSTNVATSRQ